MNSYLCSTCNSPLRYIAEYGQWWCDVCQTYGSGYATPAPEDQSYAQTNASADPYLAQQQYAAVAAADPALTAAAMAEMQRQMRSADFQWEQLDQSGAADDDDWDEDDDMPQARRMARGPARQAMRRRFRELRVKGFSRDEIILILRDGSTEEQVIEMRGSSNRPRGASPAPTTRGPGPTPPGSSPGQATTIIVQGDYIL